MVAMAFSGDVLAKAPTHHGSLWLAKRLWLDSSMSLGGYDTDTQQR